MSIATQIDWSLVDKQIANGMAKKDIAKQLGIAPGSLSRLLKQRNKENNTPALLEDTKTLEVFENNKVKHIVKAQMRVLSSISEEDIKKASLRDKGIFIGTMIDKQRLIEGKSTDNVSIFERIIHAADEVTDPSKLKKAWSVNK